jgi:mono/diheme cytochrome c family protein
MRRVISVLLVIYGVSLISITTHFAAEEEKPDPAALYKKNCVMCHKADGKGYAAMKTPDFTDKDWQASKKDDELIEAVSKGKPPMPAFDKKLSADEIKLLISDVVRKFAEQQ